MGNKISFHIAEKIKRDPKTIEELIIKSDAWRKGPSKNFPIIKGVSGIISMISSSVLIWMIVRSHKGISTTQHRLLLGLGIFDFISSFGSSTFNFMSPSERSYDLWNARGNETSCDAQGFLVLFGLSGGLFYNASLNLYYLVKIKRYDKNETYIRSKVEPILHGVPIIVALTYSIVFLLGKHFNEDGTGNCVWPVNNPPHCWGYDVGHVRDGFEIPCYRGSEGAGTTFYFLGAGMIIPAVTIVASLFTIYRNVKKQEKKISKYGVGSLRLNPPQNAIDISLWKRIKMTLSRSSLSSTIARTSTRSNNMQHQARAIMHKALQYSFAWLLAYGMYFILLIFPIHPQPTAISYVVAMFLPLQGFFNLCIFLYPKVIGTRRQKRGHEKVSWCRAIYIAVWSRGSKKRKRNRPRGQTSSLRGNRNRPLRTRNHKNDDTHDIMKASHFFREQTEDKQRTHYREPHEEEEKCEIQPPVDMVPTHQKVSDLTYAPNVTHDLAEVIDDNIKGTDSK